MPLKCKCIACAPRAVTQDHHKWRNPTVSTTPWCPHVRCTHTQTDGLSVANNKKIVADEKAITANKGIIQQNGKAIDANKKAVALNTNQVKLNKDRLAQKVTAIVKMTSAANCHAREWHCVCCILFPHLRPMHNYCVCRD